MLLFAKKPRKNLHPHPLIYYICAINRRRCPGIGCKVSKILIINKKFRKEKIMLGIADKNHTAAMCSLLNGLHRDKPLSGRAPHKTPAYREYNVCGRDVVITCKRKGQTSTQKHFCDRVHTLSDPDGTPRTTLLYSGGDVFASIPIMDYYRISEGKIVNVNDSTTIHCIIEELIKERQEKEQARQRRIERKRAREEKERQSLEKAKEKARKLAEQAKQAREKAKDAREKAKAKADAVSAKKREEQEKRRAKLERERTARQTRMLRKKARAQARERELLLDLFAECTPTATATATPTAKQAPAPAPAPVKRTADVKVVPVTNYYAPFEENVMYNYM